MKNRQRETSRHWQNIAFLPVVNALVEERLQKIDHSSVKNYSNFQEMKHGNCTDVDKIELWHQLYHSWRKSPNKTTRQIEWLSSLGHGIDSLKSRLFTAVNPIY